MSDSGVLDQSEIERLLSGLGGGGGGDPATPTSDVPVSDSAGADVTLSQDDLQALFSGSASPPPVPVPPPPISPPVSAPPISPPPVPPPPVSAAMPYTAPLTPAASFTNRGGEPHSNSGGWGASVDAFEAENGEDEEGIPRGDLDYVAKKAEESLRSIGTSPLSLPVEVIEFQFPEFGGTVPSSEHTTLDQIGEVDLDVKVELGRTYMYIEDVLKLRRGSVVPLDKMAGETVDIYINGRLLARGEVLVMNENFCVRVAELLAGAIPME